MNTINDLGHVMQRALSKARRAKGLVTEHSAGGFRVEARADGARVLLTVLAPDGAMYYAPAAYPRESMSATRPYVAGHWQVNSAAGRAHLPPAAHARYQGD